MNIHRIDDSKHFRRRCSELQWLRWLPYKGFVHLAILACTLDFDHKSKMNSDRTWLNDDGPLWLPKQLVTDELDFLAVCEAACDRVLSRSGDFLSDAVSSFSFSSSLFNASSMCLLGRCLAPTTLFLGC